MLNNRIAQLSDLRRLQLIGVKNHLNLSIIVLVSYRHDLVEVTHVFVDAREFRCVFRNSL